MLGAIVRCTVEERAVGARREPVRFPGNELLARLHPF